MKKKSIKDQLGLYPTPTTVVGTLVDGRVNWVTIAHVGIVGMKDIVLSIYKGHYSNRGIEIGRTISVNIVTRDMLVRADYVGLNSGKNIDKSQVFDYYFENHKTAPIIEDAKLSMECEVMDIYETETEYNYILRLKNTLVAEEILDSEGNLDVLKLDPVMFDMRKRSYLSLGEKIGDAYRDGKEYRPENKK